MRPVSVARRAALLACVFGCLELSSSAQGEIEGAAGGLSPFDPPWSAAPAIQTIVLAYDTAKTPQQNGAALKQRAQALVAGQTLEVGAGVWFVDSFFTLNLQGTAAAPIRIQGARGGGTVLTRSDNGQNALNIGSGGAARYLALTEIEITGGDIGLRLYNASNVWIDRCHIHHTAASALTANTANTDHLYLTRNEIDHTGNTGEGMYLGANNGQFVMRDSVVALNHVHDTGGSQGDGIELKQGSFNNWIVGNRVHDTPYPCILAYGTNGNLPNVIERNVCYRSGDNVMQVQGEAIVRNNLLIDGLNGFSSHDHQGQSRNLTFVHNTIVNTGPGASLASWSGRPGMVFANNAVFSAASQSVAFGNGSSGVQLAGNVVRGALSGASGAGFVGGLALADFANVALDGSVRNARPTPGGFLIGKGALAWAVVDDLTGRLRNLPLDSGCYDGR